MTRLRFAMLAVLVLLFAQTSSQRAAQAPAVSAADKDFDVRTDKGSDADAYMERFSARPSFSGVTALLRAQRLSVARLEASIRIDVIESPELGTPEVVSVKPGAGFLTLPSANRAAAMQVFLSANAGVYGLTPSQVQGLAPVADYENPGGNMSWVEFEQRINGLPVFRGLIRGGFTARGELARTTGQLVPGLDAALLPVSPTLPAAQAVSKAAANAGWNVGADSLVQKASKDAISIFARGPMADDAKAWLLYFPLAPGVARLAWAAEIWGDRNAFLILLDAEDGTVLFRKNLTDDQTQTATYNIYNDDNPAPLSPTTALPGTGSQASFIARSTMTLVGNEAPNTFNNLGWMTDGTNLTDGNNVEAGIDRDGINGVDAPVAGVNRVFNFTYNPATMEPLTPVYQNGEVTDAFYWTNVYHDRLYLLGFTEAARNFQNDNFGRGGIAGDRVSAEMQDSSGVNNANFSTPSDGGRGRMQMYIFPGPTPDRTSGIEHDVLLHELTHGTSNRLHSNATGLGSTMSRGMGEGWSDFYARSLLSTAGEDPNGVYAMGPWITYQLGSPGYVDNYYYGIRRFPYAVMSNLGSNGKPHNPLTFADIDANQINTTDGAYANSPIISNTAFEVHNIGEVWCMALLEVRARFVNRLGFATGNQRILQFVTDGMKLDPVNPTLLQGRDAIIAAANAGGGTPADIADIWAGFAVRGMGVSAQVLNPGIGSVVEAFNVPGINAGTSSLVTESIPNGRLDPGELVTVSLCVTNTGSGTSGSVIGTLLPTGGVTSPSAPQSYGAISAGGSICKQFTFTVSAACVPTLTATLQTQESGGTTRNLAFNFPMASLTPVFSENFDTVTAPGLPIGWTTTTQTGLFNPWITNSSSPDTAPNRAFAADLGGVSDSVLVTPVIALPAGNLQMTFRNFFDLESSFDGGVLEISIGGGSFQDILSAGGNFVAGGYNGVISSAYQSPISGRPAWTGNSSSYITTTVNLPPVASGQNIQLRWRMASDNSVSATGWSVDTIVLAALQCSSSQPAITAITPNVGAPGASVAATITGSNLTGASAVAFSGSGVTANIGSGGTGTSLPVTVSISAGASMGVRTVSVTTPQGTSIGFSGFYVAVPPTITGIFPNAGAPGTSFGASVFGNSLLGASAVTFSGTGVTAVIGSGTSTSLPISVSINPTATLGDRTVTLTTPAGTSPPFSAFRVTTTPAISGIYPPGGVPGTTFAGTISGTVLTGATAVTFSGTGVTASIGSGGTSTTLPLTISLAAGAPLGTRPVTVTTPGGTSPPFDGFTVALPPSVTGISPNTGSPGTVVGGSITGANLTGASAVSFSGTGVTATIGSGGTSTNLPVTISVNGGAPVGLRTVTVSTPVGGTSPPFSGFTVSTAPTITGITPNGGAPGAQVNATIAGTLLSGVFGVSFSGGEGLSAVINSGTPTSINITIFIADDAPLGPRGVSVTSPGGSSPGFNSFDVLLPPTLTGITPSSAAAGTTANVTISGTNLTGASVVTFGGTGVTAVVGSGGTSTSLPVTLSIAGDAPLGMRTFAVTNPAGPSPDFAGFTITAANRRRGQVTSVELFDDRPVVRPEAFAVLRREQGPANDEVSVVTESIEAVQLRFLVRPSQGNETDLEAAILQLNDEIIDRLPAGMADVLVGKIRSDNKDRLHDCRPGHEGNRKQQVLGDGLHKRNFELYQFSPESGTAGRES